MTLKGEVAINLFLEASCKVCDGDGRVFVEALDKNIVCSICQGTGATPTIHGRKVLEFIQKYTQKTKRRKR